MPYFRITIHLKNGKKYNAIRAIKDISLDNFYFDMNVKANKQFGQDDIVHFDVVQVSKYSKETAAFRMQQMAQGMIYNTHFDQ